MYTGGKGENAPLLPPKKTYLRPLETEMCIPLFLGGGDTLLGQQKFDASRKKFRQAASSSDYVSQPKAEFKEFKSRLKSAKTRFKLSAGLNLETFDTILSETNHNSAVVKFKPRIKFFKFGL